MQYHELDQNNMEMAESSGEQLHFCSENDLEPCTNLFSMRRYVLLSRQKNIFQNWPFAEKYLRLCLKYGVTNVLPPLEAPGLVERTSTSYDIKRAKNAGDDHDKSLETTRMRSLSCNDLNQEEGNPSEVHYLGQNTNEVSINCTKMSVQDGKKTRKYRRKMKTMAEIFATAKHCSLEEADEINKISCTSDIALNTEGEQRQENLVNFEYCCDSISELTDDGADHNNRLSKRRPVLNSGADYQVHI